MMRSEFQLEVGGTRLHAWTRSCPRPRAHVVLVHGLGEHTGRYEELVDHLVSNGVDVAAYDQRGHGRSSGRRGDAALAELLDDLDRFCEALDARGMTTPRFAYGHSFGGLVVLLWALSRAPAIAGAIASAPAIRPASDPPAWKVGLGRLLRPILPGFTMSNGVDRGGITRDETSRARYRDDPLVHRRISVRLGLDVLAAGASLLERDAPAPVPVLIMHGDADRLTSCDASQELAARVAGIDLRTWPGLYHELHHEPERETVLAFVTAWIERRLAGVSRPGGSA